MDNAEVNFVQEFTVLVNIDGGRPLVRDSEQEFGEEVLVHLLAVATVVDPFLRDLHLHLCIAVERRKHTVNAGEQFGVGFAGNGLVIGIVGAFDQGPKLGGDRFKFKAAEQFPLLDL